jgi:uncharacterized damage-inducible protein DinB
LQEGGREPFNARVGMEWVQRRFEFTTPIELWPVVVERLRGTPARVDDKVRRLPLEWLARRNGERWSIQEHMGHLLDLDALHEGRLDDYAADAAILRAWDGTNARTWEANHNARDLEDLLREFRSARGRFVERLDGWEPAARGRTAMHPRLQRPMRVLDMAFFVAEHDDHHLATMTALAARWSGKPVP